MKSILYSDKEFGGAEIYVRNLSKKFGVDFVSIKKISFNSLLKIINNENKVIFHDLRAACLKFLRPFSKDLIVIHGPGRIKFVTRIVVNFLRLTNSEIVIVSDDLYKMFNIKFRLTLLRNFSSFSDVSLNNNNKDFIYFGRLESSKGVNNLVDFWQKKIAGKTLHLIGDGQLYPNLIKLNNPNIIIHGSLTQNSIKKIIKEKCRFYISLSPREGLSLSLLEALSCGLIPLVMNIPTQHFIQKDYGFELINSNYTNLARIINGYSSEKYNFISNQIIHKFYRYSDEKYFYSFWKKNINNIEL